MSWAEIDGKVVAALPLRGGKVMADPFRPTAHLIPLLELRAKQLATAPAPDSAGTGCAASCGHSSGLFKF